MIQIGDIYAYEIPRSQEWSAIQVTAMRTEGRDTLVAVLQLDYLSPLLPQAGDLSRLRPLHVDFLFWRGGHDHKWCAAHIPKHCKLLGNTAILADPTEVRSYGAWPNGYQITKQRSWQTIDQQLRDRFKAATNHDHPAPTLWTDGNRTITVRTNRVDSDDFEENGPPLEILNKLDALTKVVITRPLRALHEFLKHHRLLYEADLSGLDVDVLDLTSSHLSTLTLNATGIRTLRLPDGLSTLTLTGTIESLEIDVVDQGRWLNVSMKGTDALRHIIGLNRLSSLYVGALSDGSASDIASQFSELDTLYIWGAPGHLRHVEVLGQLKQLREIALFDVFGIAPAEFPPPEAFPLLASLTMVSVPADLASWVKAAYKASIANGLQLDIRQPRKEEWLAENLDNPFRTWDGREGITPTQARKATAAYKALRKAILKLDAENARTSQYLHAVASYAEVLRDAGKRKPFIYTEEREQVYGAVQTLIETINAARTKRGVSPIDYEQLWQEIDRVGDF
jgi:hypothetical protein